MPNELVDAKTGLPSRGGSEWSELVTPAAYAERQRLARGEPQYPQYSVGGQTFSRVNPTVPEWQEKLSTYLLQGVANAAAYSPTILHGFVEDHPGLQTKANMYKRVVLDRDFSPITEKEMEPVVRDNIADAVMRSAAGANYRPNSAAYSDTIQRPDYDGGPGGEVIGRARFSRTPDGGAVVHDRYNFNNYEQGDTSQGDAVANAPGGLGGAPAWLGRRAVPQGQGAPVEVNIPAGGMLAAKDRLYGKQAPTMLGMPAAPQPYTQPVSHPLSPPSSLGMAIPPLKKMGRM